MSTILSVQSCVSYGHVGNSSITFPLQRLGYEVVPIHTVCFSNHTGYGEWQGVIFEPKIIQDIFLGVKKRGILTHCDALLNGYMGSVALGEVMLDIYQQSRAANPQLIYCCDPVMGDTGRGFFVQAGIPEFFRDHLVPQATITTPNKFELEFLVGHPVANLAEALVACRQLIERGVKIVLVTSLQWTDDHMAMVVVDKNHAYLIETPLLLLSINGAGDLTAALFTAFYLKTACIKTALELCTARIFALLKLTLDAKAQELQLIAGQSLLIEPGITFIAKPVS